MILHARTAAIRELWGEQALAELADRLSPEARRATLGAELATLKWYPTRYVLEWDSAMMDGPARGDEQAFRRAVQRSIQLGFGRIRRVLLSFATPTLLAERAAELWRHDHTHGRLTAEASGNAGARVTLAGHPFVQSPVSCIAIAEAVRQILSLSRASNVRDSHAVSGDALVIALAWDP